MKFAHVRINPLTLPPKAHKFFKAFLIAPTLWQNEVHSLHPQDWTRFYVFIRHCAQYNISLTVSELRKLLQENKFSEELIAELESIYKHGRQLLKVR